MSSSEAPRKPVHFLTPNPQLGNNKYGLHLKFVDYQEIYNKIRKPIVVNDLNVDTEAERDVLAKIIRTSYDGDVISSLPSCQCGETTGGDKRNTICEECGTPVVTAVDRPITNDVWVRSPKGVRGMMRPVMWSILTDYFKLSKLCILSYIANRNEPVLPIQRGVVDRLNALGIKRGYNYFVDNFDWIIRTLIDNKLIRSSVNADMKRSLITLIEENRDRIFTDKIPLPNKMAFITEVTALGTYVDPGMKPLLDAVQSIVSIDENTARQVLMENRTAKAVSQFATFYKSFIENQLSPKEGYFRKHIFGSLSAFSGRSVITSNTSRHEEDDLITPWGYTISLLKIDICNKLDRRGYSPREQTNIIIESMNTYSPLIHDIINELIDESPHKGIPVLFLRNPSLHRGSIQCLYITEVKTDPKIRTTSLSINVLGAYNADFDGDEMALLLIQDMEQWHYLSRLSPNYLIWDIQRLRKISGVNSLPSPLISTIANWLSKKP